MRPQPATKIKHVCGVIFCACLDMIAPWVKMLPRGTEKLKHVGVLIVSSALLGMFLFSFNSFYTDRSHQKEFQTPCCVIYHYCNIFSWILNIPKHPPFRKPPNLAPRYINQCRSESKALTIKIMNHVNNFPLKKNRGIL